MPQAPLEQSLGLKNPNNDVLTVLQRLCRLLDARLLGLERQNNTVDQALSTLRDIAITRMNEVLLPAFQAVAEMASLGAMFNANSDTSVVLGTGLKTFTLNEADRVRFAYSGFMMAISRADARNSMLGRAISYNRVTGQFVLDALAASGDAGTHADWTLTPGPAPFLPITLVDPGVDGAAVGQIIPYTVEGPADTADTVDPGLG